jgi:hypothetical protein
MGKVEDFTSIDRGSYQKVDDNTSFFIKTVYCNQYWRGINSEDPLVTFDQKSMPTWFHLLLPMETRLPRITGSQIRDSGIEGYLSINLNTLLKGESFCSAAAPLLAS